MKTFCALISAAAVLLFMPGSAYSQQGAEHRLERDIFGKARILLVCDTGIQDPVERILPKMDWQGFVERDLVIVTTGSRGAEIVNGDGSRLFLSSQSLANIRQNMDCHPGADFNLIGKDGGVKKWFSGEVWVEDLFAVIDAMPMRRYEMRQKKRKN